MSSKNKLMLILGAVLGVLYLLMFRYQLINAQFHELGGLALFALVLVHIFMNRKRITSFISNFHNKPLKARAQIIVDAVFGFSMLTIIGTGVAMAHTLPVNLGAHSDVLITTHTVASFVGLAMMGVHLGLNWNWVTNKLQQLVPVGKQTRRGFAYVSLALALFFGVIAASQVSPFSRNTFVDQNNRQALAQGGPSILGGSNTQNDSQNTNSSASDNTYMGQTICPKTGATSNCSNCHNTASSSSSSSSTYGPTSSSGSSENLQYAQPYGAPSEGDSFGRGPRGKHGMNAQSQDNQYF